MRTPKFCSECGAALKISRPGLVSLRAHCDRCAPGFRALRFLKITNLVLLLIIAFAIGRTIVPQRTVYLIGTPLEPKATNATSAASANTVSPLPPETQAAGTDDAVLTICGAPTKSGKPCQRKVKGGGYCYQHRALYGKKPANINSQ